MACSNAIKELLKPSITPPSITFGEKRKAVFDCRSRRIKQEVPAQHKDECQKVQTFSRRQTLMSSGAATIAVSLNSGSASAEDAAVSDIDTTITHKVYIDVGLCQQNPQNRTLGDNAFCKEPDQLGRIVLDGVFATLVEQTVLAGLYGNLVPATVHNFLELLKSGSYNNTLFNKVLPGEYISAGKQGSARMGEVSITTELLPNKDLMAAKSYDLNHQRAGTVSLNLSHSDDDTSVQQSRAYRNVSFLITTGPGPASSLDGTNVVFGKVLQGMDTVARVTAVPTFKPVNDRLLALNRLGSMLGDERAEKTRKKWGRPLKPILITDSGILS